MSTGPSFLKRSIILLSILVLPSLAYLFLKTGKNNFKHLAIFGPRDVAVNGKDTIYHKVPAFTFTDQEGKTITEKTFDGKIYVANFFFASCRGICPKMSDQMQRLATKYANRPDILLISHTVNPEHDSVPVLAAYAKSYKADPSRWYFVTGNKNEIYDIARHGYFISALEGDGGPEDFIHDEKFILVDKEKHIRGYYDGTSIKDVGRLLDEIKVLTQEYKDKGN